MVHTLVGIGSLVSEASARRSFAFTNFRIGEVRGWRRCFNQANWVNQAHGWGTVEAGNVAALAMVPSDAKFVSRVALLDVSDDDLRGFYERETGYNIRTTPFWRCAADGTVIELGDALVCTACADDAEADALWAPAGAMAKLCPGSSYTISWMDKSLRPLWPPPSAQLLPSPGYLKLCAAAHRNAGLLDHFLDSTLLNDRQTTLRQYCVVHEPSRLLIEELMAEGTVMEEAPPSAHGDARAAAALGVATEAVAESDGEVPDRAHAPLLLDAASLPACAFGRASGVRLSGQPPTIEDVRLSALSDGCELTMVVLHDRANGRVLLEVPNALGWRLHFGCIGVRGPTPSHQWATSSHLWKAAEASAIAELASAGVVHSALRRAGIMLFSFPSHPPLRVRVLEATPGKANVGVYYATADVPYTRMWADDIVWMPTLLASDKSYFEGHFIFDGMPGAESKLVQHNWCP